MIEQPPCPLPSQPCMLDLDEESTRLTIEEAQAEALRCLSRSICRGCQVCVLICPDQAISFDVSENFPVIDLDFCKCCELCAHFCPKGAITMESDS